MKTIFYTYYHKKKRDDGKQPTQYTTEYGPFKDVMMLWLFRDVPCILRVEDIAKTINAFAVSNDWSIEKINKFLNEDRQIEWNKSTLFSSTEDKRNKLLMTDWKKFIEDYRDVIEKVFGPPPSVA